MQADVAGAHLLVADVQRFCTHDGPGLRTVIFFKGCPLRCSWCQNPETISPRPELAFHAHRCAGCLRCVGVCEAGALSAHGPRVARDRCEACGACVQACPHEALRLVGQRVRVERLAQQVQADRAFFQASGGGLTLSGGEPLLQHRAVARLLSLCKEADTHTMVETCGAVKWAAFQAVLPHTDQFYFDLKAGGRRLHLDLTGSDGRLVLRNARRLVEAGAEVIFRMPVVPGINDSEASVLTVASFLLGLGRPEIRLLRYHAGGRAKARATGNPQPRLEISADQADWALERVAEIFSARGVAATVEGAALTRGEASPPVEDPFTPRVWRLREAVRRARPGVCAERARIVTSYQRDRRNRNKPAPVQRAETLCQVLRLRSARIYPDELLVGNFSSRRVGGSIMPELHGVAQLLDMHRLETRPVNPLEIAPEDRAALAREVLPYWATRHLAARAFPLHRAPGFYREALDARKYLINEASGISHLVPDYALLLREGTSGIARQAAWRRQRAANQDARDFYLAVQIVCRGVEAMAANLAREALALARRERDPIRRSELEEIARTCRQVPAQPAASLRQALQSLLLVQIALNQESLDNSVCPGRLDQVLWPYYEADHERGDLTRREAAELIGCFTVKMSEIIPVFSSYVTRFHGGLFSGQVVVVGGQDRHGQDAENELTHIFLDAMERLRMRQPNYHARLHRGSSVGYVRRVAAMLRDGSGAPSLMNDEVVVPMLQSRGMSREHALDYSPVGCVEPVSCGRTFGSTDAALTNVARCLEWALGTRRGGARTTPPAKFSSAEELFSAFEQQVQHLVARLMGHLQPMERANARFHPTPLTSALLQGCMEAGRDASSGGARYNASGIQAVGVVDVADSLAAVAEVVFQARLCSMATLLTALKKNFEGYGWLQGHLVRAPKFGNDEQAVDGWVDAVMGAFAGALSRYENTRGGAYLAGFYSVTSHGAFGEHVGALPSGRPSGAPLANGLSPADGMDRRGPTAALSSVARLDLAGKAKNGITVNLKLDPTVLPQGEGGVDAVSALIRGYAAAGGMQVQLNVMDPEVLQQARAHPERHPWLLVRVSGYSAYFADLAPAVQQEIIQRTCHGLAPGQGGP